MNRRWICRLLVSTVLSGIPGTSLAEQVTNGIPGVEYRHVADPTPCSMHVVSFDLAHTDLAVAATVGAGVQGQETVPAMVACLPETPARPVAAINGDFFEYKGEPRYFGTLQGLCIVEGELVAGPPSITFWTDAQGHPRIGQVNARFTVTWPDGSQAGYGINCSTRDFKSEVRAAPVVLFTPAFGVTTHAATGGLEFVLERVDPDAPWLPLRANISFPARISSIHTAGDCPIPADGMVLSVARTNRQMATSVRAGETVTIRTDCIPDMTGVRTAIGGSPPLLADGRILPNPAATNRAPRTVVGMAGNRVWFVVMDGRLPSLSIGASHHEMAERMQQLGCTDALNLDGGGSSTLWYNGAVVNHPSAGWFRPVGNALILLKQVE